MQTIHVISHTHWDREWYRPFQVFRARLVGLIDDLLDLMDAQPEYAFFHLDGQTALLKDYLEIRPEQEPRLKRLIGEGKILVGPWYTQPDEFLVSGEALIRNLLLGRRIATYFGGCMALGYLPDTFGHTGQMPQILAGFGFPAAILFRGISHDHVPSAFTWRGTDGTAILTIKMPDETAYSNFFYGLQSTLAAGSPIDWAVADRQLAELRSISESTAVSDHLLWMDGVDHVYPNPKTPALIAHANAVLPGTHVIHSTLPAYVQATLEARPNLVEQNGELRHANRAWRFQALLANVASSHIRIKQANHACQTLLEKDAEPLCAFAWLHGGTYPRTYLDLAWKTLLQNHAHDSICGCSIDQVHREMRHRYDQVSQVGAIVQEKALDALTAQVDTSFATAEAHAFVLYNGTRYTRTGTVVVDVPVETDAPHSLVVRDSAGQVVPHQVLSVTTSAPLRQPRYDVPRPKRRQVYRMALDASALSPYSLTAFSVRTIAGPDRPQGTLFTGPRTMENTQLRASLESDGSLTLVHHATGHVYRGLLVFEDGGDGGDGWQWVPPQLDAVYLSTGTPVEVARIHDGPQMAAMRLTMQFRVPSRLHPTPHESDPARMQRSQEMVALPVEITLSLAAGSPRLDIEVALDNRALNHRLRLLFPTGVATQTCFADDAYDVVERPITQPDSHDWREPQLGTYPHHSFVGVTDGIAGLAILTAGTPEYEVIDDPQRTIAITLLRAFGRGAGEPHEYLDSQEPGPHAYRLAIFPFAGSWEEGGVVPESRLWVAPPVACEAGVHSGTIASGHSLLRIDGTSVDVTAVKLCEGRETLLVRCVNLSNAPQAATLALATPIREAYCLTLAEERTGSRPPGADGTVRVELAPRQIATVELVADR